MTCLPLSYLKWDPDFWLDFFPKKIILYNFQVDEEKLEVLINHIDFVVVLFYKENDPASKNAAVDVDSIDDNLKERGISIVKTKNKDQIEMLVFLFKSYDISYMT